MKVPVWEDPTVQYAHADNDSLSWASAFVQLGPQSLQNLRKKRLRNVQCISIRNVSGNVRSAVLEQLRVAEMSQLRALSMHFYDDLCESDTFTLTRILRSTQRLQQLKACVTWSDEVVCIELLEALRSLQLTALSIDRSPGRNITAIERNDV